MIEEVGIVRAVRQESTLTGSQQILEVETQIKTSCGACQAKDDCGTGILARAFAPKSEALQFVSDQRVVVGQKVRLGIPEHSILSASFLLYLVPLLATLALALVAQQVFPSLGLISELWVIAFTLSAGFFSFSQVKRYLASQAKQDYQPKLLGVLIGAAESIDVQSVDPRQH